MVRREKFILFRFGAFRVDAVDDDVDEARVCECRSLRPNSSQSDAQRT